MKRIVCLVLGVCLIFCLCSCGQKTDMSNQNNELSWQEQYDLGVRYLSEGNYEEAIIAFTTAIEIDPKNPTAYIGLADAYIQVNEYDKALDVLNQGLEKNASDADMLEKISEISALKIKLAIDNNDYSAFFDEEPLSLDDWTVGGKPLLDCGFEDFWVTYPDYDQSSRQSRYFSYDFHWPAVLVDGTAYSHNFIVHFDRDEGGVNDMQFDGESQVDAPLFQPELKGIQMNEDFITVLEKLGISEAGISYLQNLHLTNESFIIDLRYDNGPRIYFSREYRTLHFQYSNPILGKSCAEVRLKFDDAWNLAVLRYEIF